MPVQCRTMPPDSGRASSLSPCSARHCSQRGSSAEACSLQAVPGVGAGSLLRHPEPELLG